MPFPLVARDWLSRSIWKQIDEDKFVAVYKFINEAMATDMPLSFTPSTLPEEKRIRGQVNTQATFERLPNDCTKFTYITKVDAKGRVPKVVAESGLAGVVETVCEAYQYFERDDEIDKLQRDGFIAKMYEMEPTLRVKKNCWGNLFNTPITA